MDYFCQDSNLEQRERKFKGHIYKEDVGLGCREDLILPS